jgi:Sec-independent protein translocase protein TatA
MNVILFLESIGTMEVVVILLFVLIFFGSKSIPDISRTIGRTMRDMRDASQSIKDEINKSTADMKTEIEKNRAEFEKKFDISKEVEAIKNNINDSNTSKELNELKSTLSSDIKSTQESDTSSSDNRF